MSGGVAVQPAAMSDAISTAKLAIFIGDLNKTCAVSDTGDHPGIAGEPLEAERRQISRLGGRMHSAYLPAFNASEAIGAKLSAKIGAISTHETGMA